MATLSLDQKRLSQLRTQLYGKPEDLKSPRKKTASQTDKKTLSTTTSTPTTEKNNDEHYVKKDLTKVFVLSAVILILQFAIHFALVHKWLVINFYGITY